MIGFDESEVQIFRSIMLDMDADMVKVNFTQIQKHTMLHFTKAAAQHISTCLQIIVCDRQMFQGTLCQAMEAPGHMHTQVSQ